jgi:hypothetical protein
MKTLVLAVIVSMACAACLVAQAPKSTPAAKLTARDIRGLPFAREQGTVKFKPGTRELPSELTVSTTDHIRIWGKRKSDAAPTVRGITTGFIGQIALLPAGDRSGTIFLKKDFGNTEYLVALELADDTLESHQVKLKEGKTYNWSVKTENGQTTLRILDPDGTQLYTQSGAADKVVGYGFAATCRNRGNEVDMSITYQ